MDWQPPLYDISVREHPMTSTRLSVLAVSQFVLAIVFGAPLSAGESPLTEPQREQLQAAKQQLREGLGLRAKAELSKALDLAGKALAVEEEILGPGRLDLNGALNRWMNWNWESGNFDVVHRKLEAILNAHLERKGPDHWEVHLIESWIADGKRLQTLPETDRADLRRAGQLLAGVLTDQEAGKFADALKSAGELKSLRERLFAAPHGTHALSGYSHGVLHQKLGDLAAAQQALEAAIAVLKMLKAPDESLRLLCLRELAVDLAYQKQFAAAAKAVADAQIVAAKSFGEESLEHSEVFVLQADIEEFQGNGDAAEAVWKTLLPMVRSREKGETAAVAEILRRMGWLWLRMGRHTEALKQFEESAAVYLSDGGANQAGYVICREKQGLICKFLDRPVPAEKFLREAHAAALAVYGKDSPGRAAIAFELAPLVATSEPQLAAALFAEARAGLEKPEGGGREQPGYVALLEAEAAFEQARGHADTVLKIRQEIVDLRVRPADKPSIELVNALLELGNTFLKGSKDAKAAVAAYRRALETVRQLSNAAPLELRIVDRLAQALELAGDKAEAETLAAVAAALNTRILDLGEKSSFAVGFYDNFERDTLGQYTATAVVREAGSIRLTKGALLVRALKGGPITDIVATFRQGPIADTESRQTRFVLGIDDDELVLVDIVGERRDGELSNTLKLIHSTPTKTKSRDERLVRSFSLPALLADDWKIRLQHGLVQVENGGQLVGLAFLGPNKVVVTAVAMGSTGLDCREFSGRSSARERGIAEKDKPRLIELAQSVNTHFQAGRVNESVAASTQLEEAICELLGPDSRLLFEPMLQRMGTESFAGKNAEAVRSFDRLLALAERVFGTRHPKFAQALEQRGDLENRSRNPRGAVEYFERSLAILSDVHGASHPSTRRAEVTGLLVHGSHIADKHRHGVALFAAECRDEGLRLREERPRSGKVTLPPQNRGQCHQGLCGGVMLVTEKLPADCQTPFRGLPGGRRVILLLGNGSALAQRLDEDLHVWFRLAIFDGDDRLQVRLRRIQLVEVHEHIGQVDTQRQGSRYEQALAMRKRLYPADDWRVGISTFSLANLLVYSLSEYEAGRQSAETALRIYQVRYGEDGMGTLEARNLLFEVLRQQRKFDAASVEINTILAVTRKSMGERHPDVAMRLHQAAQIEEDRLQFEAAGKLHEQALAIRREQLGPRHPDVALSLISLGDLHQSRHDFPAAERCFQEALEIRREIFGANHEKIASVIASFASLRRSEGKYRTALELWEQCLAMREKLGDPLAVAETLGDEGELLVEMGRFDEATRCFQRVLASRTEQYGKDHLETALPLTSLGYVAYKENRLADAASLYAQAMSVNEKWLGRRNPRTASSIHMLGYVQAYLGEFSAGRRLLQEALEIREQCLAPDDADIALSHFAMAEVLQAQGDHASAGPHIEISLRIRTATCGPEHPLTAGVHQIRSVQAAAEGKIDEALELLNRALAIRQSQLGELHMEAIETLLSRGYLEGANNRASAAAISFEDAARRIAARTDATPTLRLLGLRASMATQVARQDIAATRELAAQISALTAEIFGGSHPQTLSSLEFQVQYEISLGHHAAAQKILAEVYPKRVEYARQQFDALSEVEALLLVEGAFGSQQYLSAYGAIPGTSAAEAYGPVWETKGMLGQELADRRRLLESQPEVQVVWQELLTARLALSKELFRVQDAATGEDRSARITELNRLKETAERKLAAASSRWRRSRETRTAGFAELARQLPRDVAVVDFVRTFRWKTDLNAAAIPADDYWRYEAFVLRSDPGPAGFQLTWLRLGSAVPIERAVLSLRNSILATGTGSAGKGNESGELLRKQLWEPLELHLQGCRTVVLIPDADLSLLPWAALPGRALRTYLLEDYALAVAGHGRQVHDVLSAPVVSLDNPLAMLVGGLNYDSAAVEPSQPLAASRPVARRRGGDVPHWESLPGTSQEIRQLAELWKAHPESVAHMTGSAASEAALRAAFPGRQIIHLATHGFFVDERVGSAIPISQDLQRLTLGGFELKGHRATVTSRNPLLLSGLVVSGANSRHADSGDATNPGDDGILTAEEIVMTDLSQAQLVVLSACETGLGQAARGEGVLGLQRAFQTAGARTAVTSLWKVDDVATPALMTEFYRNLLERRLPRLESLRQAQLTVMKDFDPRTGKLRGVGGLAGARSSPAFWAAFVLSGDWR